MCTFLAHMRCMQGDAGVTELLANIDAEVTLLAPTNQGLAIETLDKPATPVRPLVSASTTVSSVSVCCIAPCTLVAAWCKTLVMLAFCWTVQHRLQNHRV